MLQHTKYKHLKQSSKQSWTKPAAEGHVQKSAGARAVTIMKFY